MGDSYCSTRELLSLFLCMRPQYRAVRCPASDFPREIPFYSWPCIKAAAEIILMRINQLPLQEAPNSPTL